MKIDHFDPPARIDDFGGDAALKARWSRTMSENFDVGVASVTAFLAARGGGTCQFYNPATAGRAGADLPPQDIPWNGFPKRFLSTGPGAPTRFADAEPTISPGDERPQDEYLEWHVIRKGGKISSVHFTCEGWDYYQFLAEQAPDALLALYRKFISPDVQKADLFADGEYNRLNRWNTRDGAMHLTNQANNLFAEVFLAASGTALRKDPAGHPITAPIPLIKCAKFGDPSRNSDPTIGAGVNGFARGGRMVTLADPVGLYIHDFDGSGFTLPDGSPADGFFKILRGAEGQALRAVFEPSAEAAANGITVSDVSVDGEPIEFGGQIAQKITMKLTGVASVSTDVADAPVGCGAIPQAGGGGGGLGLVDTGREFPPTRGAE